MPAEELDRGGGLGYLLIQAAQAWRNQVATRLRDVGVTPAQFFVLVSLLRRSKRSGVAMTQRDLAERTRMDANTTSQVVRGLQRRELLTRAPHAHDSRAVNLSLTPAGTALARECATRVRAINTDFFECIDQSVLEDTLTTLLHKAGPR